MAFFNSAIGVLQTLVIALGAGLGIWGAINLLEGYGNDNPGAKSQGMKQLMAGGGVALIGTRRQTSRRRSSASSGTSPKQSSFPSRACSSRSSPAMS